MDNLKDEDLDQLINRINGGDCVLFLGPDLFRDDENTSLYSIFSRQKCEQMKTAGVGFDENHAGNMYYTVGRYIKGLTDLQQKNGQLESTSTIVEKRAFVNLVETRFAQDAMYKKLAQLPFYLTINTNPDGLIHELQKANPGNRQHFFSYYDFTRDNNEVTAAKELPDEINPGNFVVYNVYGHATKDRARSVILGESEFVTYTRKINLAENGMPLPIKNFIKNDKVCLFLGFQYDSWPLKILLHALGFSSEIPKRSISFYSDGLLKYQSDFFSDEMKFMFINSKAEQFIDDLFDRFTKKQNGPTVTIQPREPLKGVFVSAAFPKDNDDLKKDIRIRNKLSEQLMPLQRKGYLSLWSEDMLRASENREALIQQAYEAANIFILLGSSAVADKDVSRSIERAMEQVALNPGKRIIPVYVRHFMYAEVTGIPKGDWIPKLDKTPVPIIDQKGNEDERSAEVSEVIRQIIYEMLS